MRTIIRDNYTPQPGDYHDMYVFDEARGKSWRFDCDGVFYETTIENELGDSTTTAASQALATHIADGIDEKIAEEAATREAADDALQEEIDDLKNSPDVVDIVATYADLMDYDTSKLGDNDVVRVLTDETHDNESSYYRWDKTNNQWVFIGAVEGYYTKDQTDDLLDEKQDKLTAGANILIDSNNVISATDTTYSDFVGTDGSIAGTAGLVPAPATTDAGKFLKADGTWDTAGSTINVVQTTGTSTTDVMSQDASTKMVYAASDRSKINIGNDTNRYINNAGILIGSVANQPVSAYSIKIGYGGGNVNDNYDVAVGYAAGASGQNATALGYNARANYRNSVAIGANSKTTMVGQFDISSGDIAGGGYNNSKYRLLTGLYDGQSAHDAVTKGQLDSIAIKKAGAPTTSTVGTVGQLLEDTTNGKLYQCTAVDTTDPQNPVYTWEEVGGGGGSSYTAGDGIDITNDVISATNTGKAKVLTSADFNYPAANPDGVALWLLEPGMYVNRDALKIYIHKTLQNTDRSICLIGGRDEVNKRFTVINTSNIHNVIVKASDGTFSSDYYYYPTQNQTGTSSTYSISQSAATSMIFSDPANRRRVGIGNGVTSNKDYGIAIGFASQQTSTFGISIGTSSKTGDNHDGSIALGAYSGNNCTAPGIMDIGSSNTTYGYNTSNYRLLSGVYDGQSAHDAATLAQGNTLSSAAPTTTTAGVLGQLYSDTTNGDLYHCTAIDTTDPQNPVYTWSTVGGGGSIATINSTDWSNLWQ